MKGGGGADSGMAAEGQGGGWSLPSLGEMASNLSDFWGDADPSTLGGGGVMQGAPLTGSEGPAAWAEGLRKGATDAVLSQYPGYGILWTYDGGIKVKLAGWLAIGGLGLAAFVIIGGR